MDHEDILTRLAEPAGPILLAVVGIGVLLGGYALHRWLNLQSAHFQTELRTLLQSQDASDLAFNHYRSLADLKTNDVAQFKAGMSSLAQSKKVLFETGLSLQEERRLLEKQWEIITTYLTLNTSLGRVFLMRGDQPLESYLIDYIPVKAFGGTPASLPHVVRIVSKERFANPERGSSEMINGKLQWEPPQVGTSVRSNALGEYVLFTNSKLILHGPPRNPVDHEAFPHQCLGLSLEAARNLYQHSFIGTKILLTGVKVEAAPGAWQVPMSTASIHLDTATHPPHGN